MSKEIFFFDLPASSGRAIKGPHPAIIFQYSNGLYTVIPMSTGISAFHLDPIYILEPDATNGLTEDSAVLIFQITSVDQSWRRRRLGSLSTRDYNGICELLKNYLGISAQ